MSPKDRVVGIRTHKKTDLLQGCNEPGQAWYTRDVGVFQKTFCRICRNDQCLRAQGATTPWHQRMENQPEYLLNNPVFSDLTSGKHKELAAQVFEDLTKKALRLELARVHQDWVVPPEEEGPTDGFDQLASKDASKGVEEAIRALGRAMGKDVPEPEPAPISEGPQHFQESQEPAPEYETLFPSSDGRTNYRVALTKGKWSCVCKGFEYTSSCKHVDQVAGWYEGVRNLPPEPEPVPEPPKPVAAPPPAKKVQVAPPMAYNTSVPSQGIVIGPGPIPQGPGPSQLPREAQDPWAPRKDNVIQPGATVVLKPKK